MRTSIKKHKCQRLETFLNLFGSFHFDQTILNFEPDSGTNSVDKRSKLSDLLN